MRQVSPYSKYRPKLYHARVPIFWWVHRWEHVRFITREFTSVFVAFYAIVLLFQIRALSQGPDAYAMFLGWLRTPIAIGLHIIAFMFVIFHSITWFNLAPRAIVIRFGRWKLPDRLVLAMNLLAWVICSVIMGWFLLTV